MKECSGLVGILLIFGISTSRCAYQNLIPEFPERPGALRKFLQGIYPGLGWNISMFHYRNHGAGLCIVFFVVFCSLMNLSQTLAEY
jgi:hypothetical protein